MKEMKVEITFLEEVLGMANADPNIHEEFIASKAPDAMKLEEEIEAIGVDGVIKKTKTIFPRDENDRPCIWDYQIKGFFKDACGMLRKVPGSASSKIKAYKKEIDGLVFAKERMIPFIFDGEIGSCQRPLRGMTLQGERISIANSETVPAGTKIEFTIECLCDARMDAVIEWLDYGRLRGMGQWRNSGKGRFTWREIKED